MFAASDVYSNHCIALVPVSEMIWTQRLAKWDVLLVALYDFLVTVNQDWCAHMMRYKNPELYPCTCIYLLLPHHLF